MTPDRWAQLAKIFSEALEREGPERNRFLEAACEGDAELYEQARRLLANHERAGDFLSDPAIALCAADEPAPLFGVGQVIASRFRIVRFIARGGMGEVYEAEDLALNARVALKTIHQRLAGETGLALFKQEVQSARKVTHPNVCRTYDIAEHGDPAVMLLTMELLDGPTLSRQLREHGPFSRREALPLIEQIAAGLQAAHDAGVIHRDFKSGNVILAPAPNGWRPVITDFGLALPAGSGAQQAGRRAGTPGYMAPEQLEGGPATPATDVYALGVVIARMTGARQPTGSKGSSSPPDAPRDAAAERKGLGPWSRVVERCLEKDPAKRYQRPADVAAALRLRLVRRRRALISIGLAMSAILPLAILWRSGIFQSWGAGNVNRLISNESDKYEFLAPAPNGRWMAAREESSGNLVRFDLRTGVSRPLTAGRPGLVPAASVSRDGKRIAYQWVSGRATEVRVMQIDGQDDRAIFQDPTARAEPLDWSLDGSQILVQLRWEDSTSQLAQLSSATGSIMPVTARSERYIGWGLFLPGTNEILIVTLGGSGQGGSDRDISAIALDGKRERSFIADPSDDYLAALSADGRRLLFVSDRGGNYGVWAQRLAGGSLVGAPQLVAANSGAISPLGLTRSGALYYTTATERAKVHTATLDLNAGKTVSPPRFLPYHSPRSTFPAWSKNGQQLSFVASSGTNEMALVLFTPASGAFRKIPVAFQRPLWRTSHTLVGVGDNGHYEIDTNTGEARLLIDSKTSGTRWEGAWSPDGGRWYNRFTRSERGLFRYDFRTKSRQILFVPGPGMNLEQENLALSPDGKVLAFQVRDPGLKTGTLMLLPTGGGEPRPLLTVREPESFQFGAFAWLPDSKRLLVARSRDQMSELWLVPADGGPPRKIDFPATPVRSLRMSPDGKTIAFHTPGGKSELRVLENFLR